jgi:hypothetical protein
MSFSRGWESACPRDAHPTDPSLGIRLDETWRASGVDSLWTRVDSKVVDFPSR